MSLKSLMPLNNCNRMMPNRTENELWSIMSLSNISLLLRTVAKPFA
jgi:hypothetical protein